MYTLGVKRLSQEDRHLTEEIRTVNRLARMVVATLALLCLFTIGAGAALAHLLPPRLALFQMPRISGMRVAGPAATPPGVGGSPGGWSGSAPVSPSAVATRLAGLIGSGSLGPSVGAMVVNLATGRVLYAHNATVGLTPASTTKIATAIAALDVLGPAARFTTSVTLASGSGSGSGAAAPPGIVLVGGGDPTLAAGKYPAGDYPQPATLRALAAATASALRARGTTSVRLRFDDSLFTGPVTAPGWPGLGTRANYISSGNMTMLTGLEVDQGRLTPAGAPEDSDDPLNFMPRSLTPSLDAARAFASFLRKDGIVVHGGPVARRSGGHPAGDGTVIASVQSPPLPQIVQQMLSESNNVIAETLARQVALATGKPATFAGAAGAVMAVDRGLGVAGIRLYDGSGLSKLNLISPQALVSLVRLAAGSPRPGLRAAITGMPVSGFSGTLGPFSPFGPFGQAALGTVRAKTGNLTGVATMAGLVYTRSGQLLAFAFMGNGISAKLGVAPESALAALATALAGCGCG